MVEGEERPSVDAVTVIALGMILLPLTTMWHEIGGHATTCVALGGRIDTIGAFYVDCSGLDGWRQIAVSCAGAAMDTVLAIVAWSIWRRTTGDLARLVWWYIAVCKGFVAAGYLAFSGVSGFGDFGTDPGNGLASLPWHPALRIALIVVGGLAYWRLYMLAARTSGAMIGQGLETKAARRTIAHVFYATIGVVAVVVGLFNPIGIVITILSAAASSFGGNAGLISVGFATSENGEPLPFGVRRNWVMVAAGIAITLAFAIVLGPSLRF